MTWWEVSDRADPAGCAIADRHYSRQTIGAPQSTPDLGMVTFVDAAKVRRKRDPGRCYRRAGWDHVGFTRGGLWAFQLLPADMPPVIAPLGANEPLFGEVDS